MDWIDLALVRTSGRICERGNESSGSIKCGELLNQLRNVSFSGRQCSVESLSYDFCLTVHHQLGKVIQMKQLDATMIS